MPIRGDFLIEVCAWANTADREAMVGLREEVFVREQRVPRDMEIDDDDACSVHVLARTPDGKAIGTARLAPGGRIGRMAVSREWRGKGVGTALLEALTEQARARHITAVSLHAQVAAAPFYLRHGFAAAGPEFDEAGIPHVLMQRTLDPPETPERPPPAPAPEPVALRAGTREELIAATRHLLACARHDVCIMVRELHPLLLNDTACVVELRRIAISGRGASIRILAQDLTRALQEGSRLLELAQRLSSVIEVRRPVEQVDLEYRSAFMCIDESGYLFRPLESAMDAVGSTWAPARQLELRRLFEAVWARSESWPELRALGI